MVGYDHYAEATRIADEIDADGFTAEAQSVRGAIADGLSGTEFFMQLRFYLAPLQDAQQLSPNTSAHIITLLEKIDEALAS